MIVPDLPALILRSIRDRPCRKLPGIRASRVRKEPSDASVALKQESDAPVGPIELCIGGKLATRPHEMEEQERRHRERCKES
jgi:hypothetical protein